MNANHTLIKLGSCIAMVCAGMSQAAAADNVVIRWNNAVLEAVREAHPGPPMVARMLFVTHTCIFDAWAAYDDSAKGTQLGKSLRQPKGLRTASNTNQAISYAAYRAAVDLFPAQQPIFDALMLDLGYDPSYNLAETSTPAGIGNTACGAVLTARHADGSNQLGDLHAGAYSDYTGYLPTNGSDTRVDPNHWQPLTVSDGHGGTVTQKSIAPFWGQVTPFALKSIDQYPVKAPALAGTAAYRAQVDQVLAYSANLTDREKVIAEYWADGPSSELPPGHWNLFAQYISRRDRHGVGSDAQMFLAVNGALMDASVWTWGVKRKYDYVRPITAVHWQYANGNVTAWSGAYMGAQSMPAANWRPYQAITVVTPPFSEYVSGHSTFSAAAAAVLRGYTGSDRLGVSTRVPAGASRVEPGAVPAANVTLSWPTFTAAADEAGLSRRFGGIHFIDGDLEGRRVGKLIGDAALTAARKLFDGDDGDGEGKKRGHGD